MFKFLLSALVACMVALASANEFHAAHVVDLKADFTEKVQCQLCWRYCRSLE